MCGAVVFLTCGAVHARPSGNTVIAVPSDFDLSAHSADRTPPQRYRLGGDEDRAQFKKDKLGPHWSFSPLNGGPTLELAPRLAHVGVDWSF